jgi:adenosylhomocysteine/aminodeoxyfutalosine nucleosidase
MTIAILGAMVEEITPLLDYFKTYEKIDFAGNTFYKVNYKNHTLVIAYSKIGKVFASLTASTMIQKFGAQILLFSGVAGAVNPKLNIGDLIIATKLVQHDVDITAFGHAYGFIPEGKLFTQASEKLNEIALNVASENDITLTRGIIATGDQFVASNERKEFIKNEFNADALEMEGASVAVVCENLNVPFFILRAISDSANMDAGFDFDKFLEHSSKQSANFMVKIVDEVIQSY